MFKHMTKKIVAGVLSALLLSQAVALPGFAVEPPVENAAPVVVAETAQKPQLQNGTAVIPAGSTKDEVEEILNKTLIANYGEVNTQDFHWEYYCTGKSGLLTNDAWGSVGGFESEKKIVFVTTTFTHPALADNSDGDYQVRLEGTDTAVTLTKAAKLSSSITLREGCTVKLPYNEDMSVNYDELRRLIFENVVESTTPEGLTPDDVTIEYYATATSGAVGDLGKAWMPLEGGKNGLLTYPAISAGEQKIRISYAGMDTIYGTSAEMDVTIAERPEAEIELNQGCTVKLPYTEEITVDYSALRELIFNTVVKSSEPALTVDDVTIEYYAENIILGKPAGTHEWVPLEGGSIKNDLGIALEYPAISAGEQKLRLVWGGSQEYAPTTVEFTLTVADREQLQFNLNEGPYEVGMAFADDQSYDYKATAEAIYNAVVASTSPIALSADEVTVEYNADPTGITNTFKPLDYTDLGGLVKFGTGEWEIRISWNGNQELRGNSVTVDVTTTDNRLESAVALKEGVSITYNMDASVMKADLFNNAIDWENSTLPAKETLHVDDFTFAYYGENVLGGNINGGIKNWAPIEGGTVTLLTYPQMGAGENQQIRISYNGNADYRPSANSEGTVTVEKAKVSVTVHSTNIYADEAVPADFITTDPADTFDQYVIYAGVTSNVTTGLYLDLPERFTDNAVMKLLDPIVEKITGKTLTQMFNDGITVGELRELFSTQELLDLLDKLNIDTGTFGKILEIINKLPSIVDSLRISFGTPNRAGLYTVVAVTDNPNYKTGVGMGFLLTKMRLSGAKLTWNQEISGGKLTAEQAKDFDFGVTLSYNGDVTVDQSSVHYLYTGFTNKWKLYSSTTTPPTEPGSYIVTVVVLGGNYLAAPITRTFTITK